MNMGFNKKESVLYTNSLISGSAELVNNNSDTNSLLNSIASRGLLRLRSNTLKEV